MTDTIYAKAGEVVTCETCETPLGHFCTDVVRGSTVDSATFILPSGEHPTRNSSMPVCHACGGRGFRSRWLGNLCLGSIQAHFADGWRSMP